MQLKSHIMFQGGEAAAAAEFYASLDPDGAITSSTSTDGNALVTVRVAGHEIVVFDSPVAHDFEMTPSVSLLIEVDSPEEVDALFDRLADGGKVLMPASEYPFAQRYGWCLDRFGMSWQVRCE